MDLSNEIFHNSIDYCQNPFQLPPCHGRQYFMCPHCSYHLCFEHGQQHQEQLQNEIYFLHNRANNLAKTIHDYHPVEMIVEQVVSSLNEWKQKMYHFIDQYTEQIQIHIEQAQQRLTDQWNITKNEYLHMLNNSILEPVDQLLKTPKQIHPDEVRYYHTRFIYVQSQITNLLTYRDLLRINFDSCSLSGDINISRGHFPSPEMISISSDNLIENIPQLDRINLLHRFDTTPTDTSPLGISSYGINNSNQILITWMKPSTLVIFDTQHGLIKYIDIEPSFITINDIIWCDYLNNFLIAGAALHTFDATNHQIQQIFAPDNPQIWSITTHKTDLFICYVMGESPLIEHRSLSSFRTIKTYTRTQILPTDSPSIIDIGRCIRTNDYHIAMTVRNLTTYEWRVDIFDFNMQRLCKGEIFGHAAHSDYWCCLLTSYRSSYWLVINNTSAQETLTLIDQQARVKQQVQHEGYNICALQGEQRFVIKDQKGLAVFHC